MWCHLCIKDFTDFEDFRIHVLENHQNSGKETYKSEISEDENVSDTDDENAEEDNENAEVDDENAEVDDENTEVDDDNSETSESYEKDHKALDEEAEALEIFGNDDKASEDDVEASEVNDDGNANLCTSGKHYDSNHRMAEENTLDANTNTLSTLPGKSHDSYYNKPTDNKLEFSIAALNNLPEESYKDEDELSVSNTVQRKHKDCNTNKSDVKITATDSLSRKHKTLSRLKKPVQKKNKIMCTKKIFRQKKQLPRKHKTLSSLKKPVQKKNKIMYTKKVFHKQKQSVASYKKGISGQSYVSGADQSENSFNGGNGLVNSRLALSNSYFNTQPVPFNNYVTSQSIPNNTVFLGYPYAGQNVNNYFIRNEAVQPPIYVANPIVTQLATSQNEKRFVFNSKNILNWVTKFKIAYKSIPYPFPPSLYKSVLTVHKGIFDYYSTSPIKEESSAVLKVYEELDCIIHKHTNSVGNILNTS